MNTAAKRGSLLTTTPPNSEVADSCPFERSSYTTDDLYAPLSCLNSGMFIFIHRDS